MLHASILDTLIIRWSFKELRGCLLEPYCTDLQMLLSAPSHKNFVFFVLFYSHGVQMVSDDVKR